MMYERGTFSSPTRESIIDGPLSETQLYGEEAIGPAILTSAARVKASFFILIQYCKSVAFYRLICEVFWLEKAFHFVGTPNS